MATKKKKTVKKINWEKNSNKFARDIDNAMIDLWDLRDDVFNGEITHKEMIEKIFTICSKFNNACETFEESRWQD